MNNTQDECYIANDGNGTFAVPTIRELMDMIEDWSQGEETFEDMTEEEWLEEHGDDYSVSSADLVWHGPDRAIWDTSCFADPRQGAGHERYCVTRWPLGATWGDDVEWVYSTAWPQEAGVPSAEAVLRLIRMRDRKKRRQ